MIKRRSFVQNKLWRDKAVELLEQTGSIIHWKTLDDPSYQKQLLFKLVEEAQEVAAAHTTKHLCDELADLLEVIECLCQAHKLSIEQIDEIRIKKQKERGSFIDRKYVTLAEHLDGSFGSNYCLAQPEKYPEIE
jgi:predicted house-cleaning noncanonical NTP pyrophosphatase (MazG superfamily)